MGAALHPIDRYARRVVAGKVPAGPYHVRACERHLRDRARKVSREFPYVFRPQLADRFFRFAGHLRHYKGEWSGQWIELQPHQQFRLGSIFAWIHHETMLRRFRSSYTEIPRKNGKALALDTRVPTPRGFITMGALAVGDEVFGPDGLPTRVRWTSEVLTDRPCYRLTFSDGWSCVADADHLWAVRDRLMDNERVVLTTAAIAATYQVDRRETHHEHRYSIRVASAVDLPARADLPIDPYVLGAWLGDGSSGAPHITSADPEILAHIAALGERVVPLGTKGKARNYSISPGRPGVQDPHSFTGRLRALGVYGDKRIPDRYLWASIEQRLALLQGLMDTDGTLTLSGRRAVPQCELTLTNEALASDAAHLIASLGLKPTTIIGRATIAGRDCGPKYRITFTPQARPVFRLARKLARLARPPKKTRRRARSRTRQIVGCEPCASVPVRCIRVDRPDGLFLVGDRFVTTHNSLEAAIVALYLAFFDGEPGAEGYCIATKREQAKIVFADCQRLVRANPALRARIKVLTANLHRVSSASKLEPLGADRDSTDGLNPHVVIIDEAHAMKTRGLIDVMETAVGARQQPLINWITTAGNEPVSPCGDQHNYACRVLDQVQTDETFFAFIAHAEPTDDPWTERTWKKANPNYGVSVKRDDLENLSRKARYMPSAANAFKQKRLNLWVSTSVPWLSMEGWHAGQSAWTADDMNGEPCWIGIDLSSKIDLTAVVAVFPPTEDRKTWRVIPWCLTPNDTLDERANRDRVPYRQWADAGLLLTCPGNRIDQDAVRDLVRAAAARFEVQSIGIDPYNAGNLVQELEQEDGLTMIEITQSMLQMSGPSKDFEADVLDGLVDAAGHPLMTWAIGNVVVMRDGKDNIYPVKKRSRGRIDPVVATLLGRKLAALALAEPLADDPELVVA